MVVVSLYARVSSDRQTQENTIASQIEALEPVLKRNSEESKIR